MSKLGKLIFHPKRFFRDAFEKSMGGRILDDGILRARRSGKPTAVLVGFSDWKTWMTDVLRDYHVVYFSASLSASEALIRRIPEFPDVHVFAWSYKYPPLLNEVCKDGGIPVTFVEDGFIRSVGLGIRKTKPMSLVFDGRGMHFDRSVVTDLDEILNTHDFRGDPAVMAAADHMLNTIRGGVSKYITAESGRSLAGELGLKPSDKVIVVLGQVEDDLSIRYGLDEFMNCNQLVTRIATENPGAVILYRPHPESIEREKKHYSNPKDVEHLCRVVKRPWSLRETLAAASEAHTITSLAGLEAAVSGLTVHTYGMPFYAGWGFTVDHGLAPTAGKRRRRLTVEEVVAGAYVVYAKYFDPLTTEAISAEAAASCADAMLRNLARQRGR